ncbi:MAG: NUDIX domain-containing protein [Chloroflexi bacterium]|nr:NUDIX domain-containing protein [Chloroflexota bacterium]
MPGKLFGLSAKVLVCDRMNRCLLLRRSAKRKGTWTKWEFPGGKVHSRNNFERAILREVADATGLTISLKFVLSASEEKSPKGRVVRLILEGSLDSGKVRLGDDYKEYMWVKRSELSQIELSDDCTVSKMTVRLPADAIIMKAFEESDRPKLAPALRDTIARAAHEEYRRMQASNAQGEETSMAEWDKLPDYLKESNRQQADHIFNKLQSIGCTVHKVTDRDVERIRFTRDEIEAMAEIEHARWNAERLLNGWKFGEKKDILKKTTPYLVGWSELPNQVKEKDRRIVRSIPALLASIGLEIRR